MEAPNVDFALDLIKQITGRDHEIDRQLNEENFAEYMGKFLKGEPMTLSAGDDERGRCYRVVHRIAFNHDEIKSYGNYGNYSIKKESIIDVSGTEYPYVYYTFQVDSGD